MLDGGRECAAQNGSSPDPSRYDPVLRRWQGAAAAGCSCQRLNSAWQISSIMLEIALKKNTYPCMWMLITVVLFPDVFFMCLVITLGCQFTLSFHIWEHFVVAFAKYVFILCAAYSERHTWTEKNDFLCAWDLGTYFFSLLCSFMPFIGRLLLAKGMTLLPGEGEYWHMLPMCKPGLD